MITVEQFEDVFAQENDAPAVPLPLADVARTGSARLGPGWYDLALSLGERHGVPVVTFTSSAGPDALPLRRPAPPYLATICRGLAELGLTAREILEYLGAAPGIAEAVDPADLASAVGTALRGS